MRRIMPLVLALVAAVCVVQAPTAVAGGPTSVLIVNQADGRAAAAYTGGAHYDSLLSALGGDARPTASANPPAAADGAPVLRLVWLIHDVTPWRVDQVHVVDGTPWVETFFGDGDANPYESAAVWHRPARGAELLADLTALDVYGDRPAVGAVSAPTAPADPPASTSGASWWLVAALVLAALSLGVVADRRLAPRLATRRPALAG